MAQETNVLRLVADNVITNAVDGSQTIFNSEDVFKSWIDPDFKGWNLNKPDKKTPEIKTQVYEMAQDANVKQMFGSLNDDLDKLCLTQNQITEFCISNQKYLKKDGRSIFFPFKVDGKYYVARVHVRSGGLSVGVGRFGFGGVWRAGGAHRVVVLQRGA